jgi:HEAT repeat protein
MPTSRYGRRLGRNGARCASLLCLVLAVDGCRNKAPHEGKSVAELELMLQSDDPDMQVAAAFGLGQHGAQAQPAVPALINALNGKETLVRAHAALALGRIGPDAHAAVRALTDRLSDPEWTVRRQAALALGRIGKAAQAAIPALEEMAEDSDQLMRKAAEEALANVRK